MAIKELFYDNRPQVLFDPRASQRIDPRFTYTRNSIGTFVNEQGIIETAGVNAPRIEYAPTTGELKGMLLEQERQNVLTQSTFQTGWTSSTNILTPNSAVAPDGSFTAAKIETPVGNYNNTSLVYTRFTLALADSTRVHSVFVKKGNYPAVKIGPRVFGGWGGTIFNLDTQQRTITSATQPPIDAFIEPYPDGWYRIGIVTNATTNNGALRIALTSRISDLDGENVTEARNIYVWGAEIQYGDYATSYIPTSGTAVTRAPDLLSIEKDLPSSGSVYIDARAITTPENGALISLKNDSDDKIDLAYLSNAATFNSLALVGNYDGTTKTSLPLPVPTTNRERNILTWGANNYQYTKDSSRFAPSLSSSVPTGLNKLSIGHDAVDPTKAFNGYINTIYVWSGELTPTVAEALVRNDLEPINADTFSPVGPAGALSLVINTQGAASDGNKVFTLPAESALNDNDIVITWGDNTESGLAGAAAELGAAGLAHTYPAAGIYPVYVEGKLQNLFFNNSADANDLLEISAWGTSAGGNAAFTAPSTMNSAFYGCTKLQSIPSTNLPDTSAVTDWFRAFRDCSSLTGTFRSFNFSAATTFQQAFYNCSGITSFTAAGDQTQNVTNFNSAWYGCSGLTSFPLINTAAGTNFSSAWQGCTGLTSFPLINTSAATNLTAAWEDCTGLTSFPLINTAAATDFTTAWKSCTGLTSFPLINTAAVTNFNSAWQACSSLTSFPLINTAAGTNFSNAWRGCSSLTSFPLIDTAAGTGFGSAWRGCFSLTSFPLINTAAGTNFSYAWNNCSSLTSFPLINTAAGTNFNSAWLDCSSLTSFPLINTAAGTNFDTAWRNCSSLTAFPALSFDSATGSASDAGNTFSGFRDTWRGCLSLTDFPANRFNTTTCTRYLSAWSGCALTAQSIENILVSIEAANTSNGNLGINGGTNAAKTTWSTAANTAYDALVARGWTITFNA